MSEDLSAHLHVTTSREGCFPPKAVREIFTCSCRRKNKDRVVEALKFFSLDLQYVFTRVFFLRRRFSFKSVTHGFGRKNKRDFIASKSFSLEADVRRPLIKQRLLFNRADG